MFKTIDIVKKEDIPIARWQSSYGTINGQTVNNPDLSRIISAETEFEIYTRSVGYQVIE